MAVARCKSLSTATFTHTFRLDCDRHQVAIPDRRFEAARRLYNACLGEALRRAGLMRQSKLWGHARLCGDHIQRVMLFPKARQTYRFNLFDLFPFVSQMCRGNIGRHLDVTTARGIAARAFEAVNAWVVGRHGRPRFKPERRGLRSVAGTEHKGILLRQRPRAHGQDPLACCEVRWGRLVLPIRFQHGKGSCRHSTGHRRVIEHALAQPVKFVRLLRIIHGEQVRYYAQIVAAGMPLLRIGAGEEIIGWDLGVSTSAWVGDSRAELAPFAQGLENCTRRRRLLRRIDRQRRSANRGNYNADGTVREGPKVWMVSHRRTRTARTLADLDRRQAEQRHNENGQLANRIVSTGRHVRIEDVQIRAWTKRFGRQIGTSAPAAVVAAVVRKAERAGGSVLRVSLRLALSQMCVCGHRAKKDLGQRVHACPRCGLQMQRDLLSAYLIRHSDQRSLHTDQARECWSVAEPMLRTAWRASQSASLPVTVSSRGHHGRRAVVGGDRA